ncbi:polysaccharide biosynthesis/export family protein [Ruixingdingia sedimenti]|uniref:Polysaccharide biosynthesis/export family protein n=1 Tax=Ruixingdingia sedimenti TaxID=3073604 RepID=A0ABU1FD93_9RHOB|nr:polysaccharide biosynthesis/export family protein [Xinfangfangia sp. LG-4]MDR5654444.1 polysaccharide biosynthesis/export family protein [Xinfangfangia sp. LG-4]
MSLFTPTALPPRILALLCCTALAGCSLPRGAAIQSEIVGSAQSESRNIEVVPVTQTNLPRIAAWPVPARAGDLPGGWSGGGQGSSSQVIATGDTVALTIWENDENALLTAPTQKAVPISALTVSPAGNIHVPYVGQVRVRGMTPEQARDEIQKQVDAVLTAAQVQLSVQAGRQNTIDLVGGVAKAGSYPLPDRNFTVLSLISAGGGVSPALKNPQIKLVRGGKVRSTSVAALFDNPARDAVLRGGDKVIVEEDARHFLALGAASKQEIIPFPKDALSALDAVSLIGGVQSGRANPGGVLVLREYPATMVRADGSGPDRNRVVFTIDLTSADGLFSARNFRIQSEDLVLVTESPVNSLRTVIGLIGQGVGVSNALSSE